MNCDLAISILRQAMPALRREFGVADLAIFGSTARGEARADSDVDVLVAFDVTPDYFQFGALRRRLSDLLGREVDLVTEPALRPTQKARILADAVHA